MKNILQLPDHKYLLECFSYEKDTGLVYWKSRPLSHFSTAKGAAVFNSKYAGKRAGHACTGQGGYPFRSIKIMHMGSRKEYLEHRVIWKLVLGEEPPISIDHKNNDATDNKWLNLRNGEKINSLNRSKRITNTSGVTGVSWSSRREKWLAQICVKGVLKTYGEYSFDDLDIAAMEVMEARAELGFDSSHGLELAPYRLSTC